MSKSCCSNFLIRNVFHNFVLLFLITKKFNDYLNREMVPTFSDSLFIHIANFRIYSPFFFS